MEDSANALLGGIISFQIGELGLKFSVNVFENCEDVVDGFLRIKLDVLN